MKDIKKKFRIALAVNCSNVTKQARAWGVDESAIRHLLNEKTTSAKLLKKIKAYIKSVNINEALK